MFLYNVKRKISLFEIKVIKKKKCKKNFHLINNPTKNDFNYLKTIIFKIYVRNAYFLNIMQFFFKCYHCHSTRFNDKVTMTLHTGSPFFVLFLKTET